MIIRVEMNISRISLPKFANVLFHKKVFQSPLTHLWPFSKSKFYLKSDHVNLVAPASPIECMLHLPNVWVIQYNLGPERLTRLGNSNVLRLPVKAKYFSYFTNLGKFVFFLTYSEPEPHNRINTNIKKDIFIKLKWL